ncbi:MAG TPA: cupin domain-containing protein [Polyangiaceae bacterium]|nr:cupin domain-containing protein [Polyangiaceae bacterium]
MSTTTYRSHLERPFKAIAPGVHVSVLRGHGDSDDTNTLGAGTTALFRMEKGAAAPHHDHPGGEETYLVSGKLRVGQRVLLPGDYLWTAPGESHDGFAEEESVFFVVLPAGLRLTGG